MTDSLFPATVDLDEYEVANLREGLLLLRSLHCDTGDWMAQILNKLPQTEQLPNLHVEAQVRRVMSSPPVLARLPL